MSGARVLVALTLLLLVMEPGLFAAQRKGKLLLTPTGKRFVPDQFGDGSKQSLVEIKRKIAAVEVLLSAQPEGSVERAKLVVNRSALSNLYARRRILDAHGKTDSESRGMLERSLSECQAIANDPKMDADTRHSAREVVAYAFVYLDRNKEASIQFSLALKANPHGPAAGGMALFVGEELFEEKRYADAIGYYAAYMGSMSTEEQSIASYQIGWSKINLGQEAEARKIFSKLARGDAHTQTAKDSLRDLVNLATIDGVYEPIHQVDLSFSDRPDLQREFFRLTEASLESQNMAPLHRRVVTRILQIDNDPERRLRVVITDLKVNHTLYSTVPYLDAFTRLKNFVAQSGFTAVSPAVTANAALLEQELQSLAKSTIDTYDGKGRGKSGLSTQLLAVSLLEQAELAQKLLPSSALATAAIELELDLSLARLDWARVDWIAEKIRLDPKRFAKIVEKAAVSQLAALGEKIKRNPQTALVSRREARTKDFLELYPKSPQWLRVAKERVELLSQSKDTDKKEEASELMDSIYAREKTVDNLYHCLFAEFDLGKYPEVLADQRGTDFRIEALKSEAALKLAEKAKAKNDYDAYRENIRYFLAHQRDPRKVDAARQDYLAYMSSSGKNVDLTSELKKVPASQRSSNAYGAYVNESWSRQMRAGSFPESYELIKDDPKRGFEAMLSKLASGGIPSAAEMARLSADKQSYIEGLLVLTHPDVMLKIFEVHPPQDDHERELAALALRLRSGSWDIPRTKLAEKLLGKKFEFDRVPYLGPVPLESRIRAVRFDPKKATAVFASVRKIRSDLPKAIQGKDPTVQLRVTRAGQELERKTAEFVLKSPVPGGLSPAQIQEYSKALKAASQEFVQQSEEFKKIAEKIESAIQAKENAEKGRALPAPAEMSKWAWPDRLDSDSKLGGLKKEIAKGNVVGALILADLLRAEALPKDPDYFSIRAGLILSLPSNASLRRFLYSELEQNHQTDVMEAWRRLTRL